MNSSTQKLKVGLDYAAPIPLHTDISKEKFEGFEVNMMEAISVRLGSTLDYEVSLWKDILQKLQGGKLDVICSAVTITDDRRDYLDFSDPYLSFKLCLVVHRDNMEHDQHKANVIGVRTATEAELYARANFPESKIILSDTNDELYQLLDQRSIDAIIDDSPIAGGFTRKMKTLSVSSLLAGTESHYAIAMRRGNTTLKDSINGALKTLHDDGSYKHMFNKWFTDIKLL